MLWRRHITGLCTRTLDSWGDYVIRKKDQKTNLRFSDVDSIVMVYKGMHFELFPRDRIVKYRNCINPKDSWMHFPEGYFDEKTETVPQQVIDLISTPFAQMLFSRIPDKHMEDIPHGGDGGAVMEVSLAGSRFIYKSVHASEDGYSFEVDPVAEEFVRIIQLLKPYCSFPKFSPMETKVVIPREIPAAIRQKAFIETGKGERIIGYHCEATGAAFNCFYNNGKGICDVSWISGPSDKSVMINGKDFKWISDFEPSTLSPGLTRYINDKLTGQIIFRIVYKAPGEYVINDSIEVYCDLNSFLFFCQGKAIAIINRITAETGNLPEVQDERFAYFSSKPCFDVLADNGVPTELLMAILAFPKLKFGL